MPLMIEDSDRTLAHEENGVGTFTLNRPKALNALTLPMVLAISERLKQWKDDDSIRCVVINSVPGRAFCAGGDIRAAWKTAKEKGSAEAVRFLWHEYRMNWRIAEFPKPYIALLDGITMGGGAGLSVHGRYRVVTENTTFAMPETGIGFFPDVGGSYFLSRMPRAIGRYLGLTGTTINAGDCMATGIGTHFIPSDRLASLMHCLDAGNVDAGQCLDDHGSSSPESPLARNFDHMEKIFSAGSLDEVMEHLRTDESDFARQMLEILSSRSPLSLRVVWEELERGRTMPLSSCLRMEYDMVSRFFERSDFFEGVRALLVDKDKQPAWQHRSIREVSNDTVLWYFENSAGGPLLLDWD